MSIEKCSFREVKKKIEAGETSCQALTQSYLDAIHNKSDLNAFITVLDEPALKQAHLVDQKINEGTAGKLAGMVLSVKDIFCMKDTRTTCGSKILENFYSPYDATVVERLKSEDAVIIGKTNMDEFGMGSSNENSAYGPVLNPLDEERIPGGSSGGAAASVAADLCMTAIGTDTGGSVRQPASHCGVVGLRPTYGRVSRYGIIAFASSLDQAGIFSKTVQDCAEVLQVIAGLDDYDATSADIEVPQYAPDSLKNVKGLKIGVPEEFLHKDLSDDVKSAVEASIQIFEAQGAIIKPISLHHMDYGIATYYLLCTAEASSNLARYDGVRFGARENEANLIDMYRQTKTLGFGEEVKRRIMLGTYVLSAGYYDAYYRKAQKVRTLIKNDFMQAFNECDFILGPTAPTSAFKMGEMVSDPMQMYLSDIFTVTAPLAGVPCITVPSKNSGQMPIGIQFTAKPFAENELLQVANWFMNQ